MPVRALVGTVASAITAPLNSLSRLLGSWVEGRQARFFERERRTTLECLSQRISAGTTIYDRRADGSVLLISVSPEAPRVETSVDGARQDTGAQRVA